jgi:hypothetical protein
MHRRCRSYGARAPLRPWGLLFKASLGPWWLPTPNSGESDFVDAWFQLIEGAQAVAEYRNNQKAIRNVASISYRPSISYLCVLCVSVVKLRR